MMVRSGSSDSRSLEYQCDDCHHVVRKPLGKPGNRNYSDRFPCPRCLRNPPARPSGDKRD